MPSKVFAFLARWLDFAAQKFRKCPFFRERHMPAPDQTTRFANPPSPTPYPETGQSADLRGRVKLLISIRNTAEAAEVRQAGVDWIDLKEPDLGSLGQPSLLEAVAVAKLLSDHPQRSAALGELVQLDEHIALNFAKHFPILKVGLSRVDRSNDELTPIWQARFHSLATRIREHDAELIPVAYADWSICGAPSLVGVLALAHQVGSSHMLIDTFVKDGRGLLDWLSLKELNQVILAAREFHCGVVLAGSLKLSDIPELLKLQPTALAVRGAVCHCDERTSQTHTTPVVQARTTPIDPLKVALWRRSI